ncbi:MAG: hypothetical protein ACK58Q_00135 [Chitinophagales bacterium]|jgi:hypothetical protein
MKSSIKALKQAWHKTRVVRRFSSVVDEYVANKESKFQLQYVDYEKDQWTVPVLLTAERAYNFKNDASVKLVRILWRSVSFELEP